MPMRRFALILLILPVILNAAMIEGYIYDSRTDEPVPYCNVMIKELLIGDLSDERGFYSIDRIDPGTYTVIVNLIGYKPDTIKMSLPEKNTYIRHDFTIAIQAIEMEGINVTGERSDFMHDISISKKTYRKVDLEMPVALGEVDIMRSFQLLPSVVASSDFSSALYVRGGAPDQNLILLDNVPVFNPFHLGGIFSTFEINSIESATFYAGGFNSTYGNRISSVIDMRTLSPSEPKFNVKTDVSLISSKIFVELPEFYNVSGFVSARRTYFDKVLELVDYDFPYYFYDVTGAIRVRINDKSYLKFTGFVDRDILDLAIEDTIDIASLNWGNSTYGLNYSYLPDDKTFININAYYTEYRNTMNLFSFLEIHSYSYQYGIRGSFEKNVGNIRFIGGTEIYRDSFDYLVSVSDSEDLIATIHNPYYAAGFTDLTYKEDGRYIFNAGLRAENYEYLPHIYVSPRASFKFFLDDNTSFTVSLGDYYQYLTSIKQESGDFTSVFGDIWLPIPSTEGPQHCSQFITGLEHWFTNDISMTTEFYYKNYDNLVYATLIDIMMHSDDPQSGFSSTTATSRGAEVMLKKSGGSIQGWLGYSYSKVDMMRNNDFVSPYYDKTNSITANISFMLPWRSSISIVGNYSTGLPYTAVIGKYKNYDYDFLYDEYTQYGWNEIYSGFNEARFPAYKRIDVGVSKKFNIKSAKFTVSLNIINVFNFKNVFFYYYDHSETPSERYEFNMLPILPSLGVSGEF